MKVFNREVKYKQREAARRRSDREEYGYLRSAVVERLVERLNDIHQDRTFPRVLQLGCVGTELTESIMQRDGVQQVIVVEPTSVDLPQRTAPAPPVFHVRADEENLPFRDGAFDLVVSALTLHWVNDLPRAIREARRVLRPDGLFIAALLGENTLDELRSSLILAELERRGGVSARVSPLTSLGDVGNLLVHAGFALPTVDQEELTAHYQDAFALMNDLHGMAEQGAPLLPPRAHRETLLAAAAIYTYLYGGQPQDDGVRPVPATFNVIWAIGWAPDPSQPRPARRGSQTHSFKDINTLVPPEK